MGFRNPVTSLSASQITGGTLATDVIAQAVKSAPSGPRIELAESGGLGALQFFAGFPGETPAQITAQALGGVTPAQFFKIAGDTSVAGSAPEIDLFSEEAPGGGWESRINLTAAVVWLTGVLKGASLDDPVLSGVRLRIGADAQIPDSTGLTPYILFAKPFPTVCQGVIATVGDSSASPNVTGLQVAAAWTTINGFRVVAKQYNGTPYTGGFVRVNYLAWGY